MDSEQIFWFCFGKNKNEYFKNINSNSSEKNGVRPKIHVTTNALAPFWKYRRFPNEDYGKPSESSSKSFQQSILRHNAFSKEEWLKSKPLLLVK